MSQLDIQLTCGFYVHVSTYWCFSSFSLPKRIAYAQSCDVCSVPFWENCLNVGQSLASLTTWGSGDTSRTPGCPAGWGPARYRQGRGCHVGMGGTE